MNKKQANYVDAKTSKLNRLKFDFIKNVSYNDYNFQTRRIYFNYLHISHTHMKTEYF